MTRQYSPPPKKPRDALVLVCVDEWSRERFSGRFYHLYLAETFLFFSQMDLVLQMDRLFDELNHPQAYWSPRGRKRLAGRDHTLLDSQAEIARRGLARTFFLHVLYRQNGSWQGTLRSEDTRRNIPFRSVLELFRLLDVEKRTISHKDQEMSI